MVKLTINGRKYKYSINGEYDEQTLDDDIVLFMKDVNKIFSMNSTASFIWSKIKAVDEGSSAISSEGIANDIIAHYDYDKNMYDTIVGDVNDTIGMFIDEELLLLPS